MGKIAPGNANLSTVAPRSTVDEIDRRRDGLSMTRSKYVALIIEKWVRDGCAAVNEADRAMVALHGPSKRKAG